MLSAVVTAKAQENCGFPGVAPGRVCPVTANPGLTMADLDLAERYLGLASEMAPRNTRIKHSMAELALKRATLATDEIEQSAWRTRAEQLAKALIRHEDSSYPHHTLAKAAVQEVRAQLRKIEASD